MALSIMVSPRNAAMDYLSRRDHSRLELEQKLKAKGFELNEVENALNKLSDENLLSDRRFAQSYLRYRTAKGFGPLKIHNELKQKGISFELIQNAEIDEEIDWFSHLNQVAERKFGPQQPDDLKSKQKRIRFLQQRGFAMHHIMRLFV